MVGLASSMGHARHVFTICYLLFYLLLSDTVVVYPLLLIVNPACSRRPVDDPLPLSVCATTQLVHSYVNQLWRDKLMSPPSLRTFDQISKLCAFTCTCVCLVETPCRVLSYEPLVWVTLGLIVCPLAEDRPRNPHFYSKCRTPLSLRRER